jgi:predicted nucleotidyltransferase
MGPVGGAPFADALLVGAQPLSFIWAWRAIPRSRQRRGIGANRAGIDRAEAEAIYDAGRDRPYEIELSAIRSNAIGHTSMREEEYLREHWPLLREMRAALRTEPNVRLAVLFGSAAVGQETSSSDIDLLVQLRIGSSTAVAALAQRLGDRVGREVQLARVEDAANSVALMVDALTTGRVLVDRDRLWAQLKASEPRWRRRATEEDLPLEDSIPDLGPS